MWILLMELTENSRVYHLKVPRIFPLGFNPASLLDIPVSHHDARNPYLLDCVVINDLRHGGAGHWCQALWKEQTQVGSEVLTGRRG